MSAPATASRPNIYRRAGCSNVVIPAVLIFVSLRRLSQFGQRKNSEGSVRRPDLNSSFQTAQILGQCAFMPNSHVVSSYRHVWNQAKQLSNQTGSIGRRYGKSERRVANTIRNLPEVNQALSLLGEGLVQEELPSIALL